MREHFLGMGIYKTVTCKPFPYENYYYILHAHALREIPWAYSANNVALLDNRLSPYHIVSLTFLFITVFLTYIIITLYYVRIHDKKIGQRASWLLTMSQGDEWSSSFDDVLLLLWTLAGRHGVSHWDRTIWSKGVGYQATCEVTLVYIMLYF